MSFSSLQKQLFALTALALLDVAVKPAQAQSNLIVNGDFSAGNTEFSTGYTYTSGSDPGPAHSQWGQTRTTSMVGVVPMEITQPAVA